MGVCNPLQWRNRPRISRGSLTPGCGEDGQRSPSVSKNDLLLRRYNFLTRSFLWPIQALANGMKKFARRAGFLKKLSFAFLQEVSVLPDHISAVAGRENDSEVRFLRRHLFGQFPSVHPVRHNDVAQEQINF